MGTPKRITNGQRAAACALRLAGVRMDDACRIVGASYRQMKEHLGRDWFKRRWDGTRLDELRAAYCDPRLPLRKVMTTFAIGRDELRLLATEQGWPKRKPGPPKQQPRKTSRVWKYRLVREVTGSRELALAALAP